MRKLTIIIPGLCWPDGGDKEHLLPQVKTPALNSLLSFAKNELCPYSYSDFYYSLLLKDKTMDKHKSLAFGYAKILGVENRWKDYLLISPTHLRIDRDRILICESELLQISVEEGDEVIALLNRHFGGECEFFSINEELWLIGINTDFSDISLIPLMDIIGENINEYLPSGELGLKLNALSNEIQMLLFDCPINNWRSNNGLLSINGVWFWDKRNLTNLTFGENEISSNPRLGNPVTDLTSQLLKNNIILIDQLYYPCHYRDAYSWITLLNSLDSDLFYPLFREWRVGSINEISLIVPQYSPDRGGVEFKLTKTKFWKRFLHRTRHTKLNLFAN